MGCEPSKSNEGDTIASLNRKNVKKFDFKISGNGEKLISENVIVNSINPTEEDLKQLEKAFISHFFFYKLKKSQLLHLIESLQGYSASKDSIIFRKGDNPNLFFYIKSGKVTVDI